MKNTTVNNATINNATVNNNIKEDEIMTNANININDTINAAQEQTIEDIQKDMETKMAKFTAIVGSICELTGFADIAESFAEAVNEGIRDDGTIDLDGMAKSFRDTLDDTIEELKENGDAESLKKAAALKSKYIDASGNTVERYNSVPFVVLSGIIYGAKKADAWVAEHKPTIEGHPILTFVVRGLKNMAHGLVRAASVVLEAIGKAVVYGVSYIAAGITAIVAKFVEVVMAGWTIIKYTAEDFALNNAEFDFEELA